MDSVLQWPEIANPHPQYRPLSACSVSRMHLYGAYVNMARMSQNTTLKTRDRTNKTDDDSFYWNIRRLAFCMVGVFTHGSNVDLL